MVKKFAGVCFAVFALVLMGTGCSNLPSMQPTATLSPTQVVATPTPQPTQATEEISNVITLSIWLPPKFAPSQDSPAGVLLQNRLNEFNTLYPNLNVTYRIKAETGSASLLESLRLAHEAAPLVLPDLILIADENLSSTAEDQLIYPYPAPLTAEDDPDWFSIGYALSTFEQQTYFLPFAADAMIVTYNQLDMEAFPASWGDLLLSTQTIAFPPADPNAFFTIALYMAEGGSFTNEDDQLLLDEAPLAKIFNFYADLHTAELLPANPVQIDSDQLAWELLTSDQTNLAVSWSSQYFQSTNPVFLAAPLPTSDGIPFTLIESWGWAITASDPNEQAAAAELARFLSAPEFTGPWTEAAHLIPLRPSALNQWSRTADQNLANQIMPAAHAAPAASILSDVGNPLMDAVLDVLTDVQTPEAAAISAVEAVGN